MESKLIESILNTSVKKSLGYDHKEAMKWSIKECANNEYLSPDYDPFKMLEYELLALTIRKKYGIGE